MWFCLLVTYLILTWETLRNTACFCLSNLSVYLPSHCWEYTVYVIYIMLVVIYLLYTQSLPLTWTYFEVHLLLDGLGSPKLHLLQLKTLGFIIWVPRMSKFHDSLSNSCSDLSVRIIIAALLTNTVIIRGIQLTWLKTYSNWRHGLLSRGHIQQLIQISELCISGHQPFGSPDVDKIIPAVLRWQRPQR